MHKLCYKQISREEIEVFFSNFYCVYIYGFSIQNKYSFTQAQTGDFFKKMFMKTATQLILMELFPE